MEQNRPAWATNILALINDKINADFRSRKLIHQKKSDVFYILVDYIARYVQFWWTDQFREEINTKSADAETVGKELLGVLKRVTRLLQQCGEKKVSAKSNLIIFRNAGEFCEIVEDVKRYSSMMNNLIARILEFGPVDKRDEKKLNLIKQLQNKVELDCSMLQNVLTSAHTQSISLDRVRKLKNVKNGFKHYLEMLVEGRTVHPFELSKIPYDDLKPEILLGSGSDASVSKGLWCETIPVAIKEFYYDDIFEFERNMFNKELFDANSSHIVHVFGHSEAGIGDHGNRKIIVMELMDMDLKKLIEEKKKENPKAPFSVDESIDLMLQIAKGLWDLHEVKVVHRDIKPANILVKKAADDGSLTIKLADFGASKANFRTNNIHTKKRGTILYMAPEMAAGDDEGSYSKKVDVYSYGLVCMEILTGKPPNPKPHSPMLEDLLTQGLSTPLYKIMSCLEKDPDKRPTFEDICNHLWSFKESILIIPDEVPKYIDERVILSNFRMYRKKGISKMPRRISTLTRKRAIYCLWPKFFGKGDRHLPIDSLVDIQLAGLGVESSGQIIFQHPWHSIGNPFIGTGVEPQNHLFGNLQDLGIFGQFKKLVLDQGKKLNLSFCITGQFSDAFSTDENRTRFINSVLELCRAYPIFNGLLIDVFVIVRQEDAENFILVLQGLQSALPRDFVIGVGVSRIPTKAKWLTKRTSSWVKQIHLCSDPGEEKIAQHRSNLYSSSHQKWSYDEAVKYYIKTVGVDSSKLFIVAADSVYGFSKADDIGKPAQPGLPNPIYDLCPSELVGHGFVERWDEKAKAPYAYHPEKRLICVYDNARSIKEKVKYIQANNLGGVYISNCHGAKPCSMLKIVHDHLMHGKSFNSI